MSKWIAGVAALVLAIVPLSSLRAEEPKPDTKTDASQGFVTFTSGDNSLTLGAWGQFRAVVDDRELYDNDTAGSGLGEEDGASTSLSIPRMRIYVQGNVYKPWLKYKIEVEVASLRTDANNNLNNGRITDGYFEVAKNPHATVRVGQYKMPFGLQELVSDTRQEFVDRSITSAKFAPSRDVGVMLWGLFADKKFGYQLGLFNGGGQNNPQDDQALLHVVRVWYDPFGEYKLMESATDNPAHHQLHIALAYRGGETTKGTATAGVFEDPNNETALACEIAWKYKRFFAMAEVFQQTDEQANPTVGPDVDAQGWHAQFGVMVQPKVQEVAIRLAEVEPDKDVDEAEQEEWRLVYGYFWRSHGMKLQADYGEIKYGENFATLSSLATRNINPGLDAAKRLAVLPGQKLTDKQLRAQFVVAF
ncbi:MAG TPA: porin [Candidatus Polarisedimenticolaceae bacterium]|nr:porin [Candidatus Polarisedimenticolaceae bacterium]